MKHFLEFQKQFAVQNTRPLKKACVSLEEEKFLGAGSQEVRLRERVPLRLKKERIPET